ncbi:T9SS type A sorting domain-containing protein [Siphonobacter aquaeclarae]|uniref:Por secretion system C-terminal sorting domain-containing protein n=1 Tax=Siphonobacter aquaeclarae TaxID=563176 RepID=A0A1G9YKB4_9BACT|nr:T9SS type A sorting domain-containing protein [Siphonobacter aquaeclarae]SDN09689.1 Por secretion system C-terminal sorting domain-containing protein [Siphonobacter aquaeclarae]
MRFLLRHLLLVLLLLSASSRLWAQSGDLEVVSIDPVPATLGVGAPGELLLVVNQNGPGTLPTGSARVTITINTTVINWQTPFAITDGCGSLWSVFTTTVNPTTTTIQIRNSQPLPIGTQCEIHLPIRGMVVGSADVTVGSTVLGPGVSDPLGTNQSATTVVLVEAPTPVTLAAFQAKASGNNVYLEWITSAERNNAFFDVLHSFDGKTFESIGQVAGNGTSNQRHIYDFIHQTPDKTHIHYYRLRQVDLDGAYQLSGIKSVQFDGYTGIALSAYTDPARNVKAVVVYGDDRLAAAATLSLLDLNGRPLATQPVQLQKGRNQVTFPSAGLSSGLYLVRFENEARPASVRVIIP